MRIGGRHVVAGALVGFLTLGSASAGSVSSPLTGTVRVKDFVVPRGAVRVVGGDLDLSASGNIEIDGTLLIERAAKLRLSAAGALRIGATGRIRSAPGPAASASQGNTTIQTLPGAWQINGGKLVELKGQVINPPAGTNVDIFTADFGTIVIDRSSIATRFGKASESPAEDGKPAGNIVIGGAFGRNAKIVITKSYLIAASGGSGYTDRRGRNLGGLNPCKDTRAQSTSRGERQVAGTAGGKGGSIKLRADQITIASSTVSVGDGGRGGDADGTARSGSSGHAGQDIYAWAGDGGEGGAIVIDGDYTGPQIHAGRGGPAGSVTADAGNGAPGCDGGRTTAVLGAPGERGLNQGSGTKPPGEGWTHFGDVTLESGGNGGDGQDDTHAGGAGGEVLVLLTTARKNHPRDQPPASPCCYFRHIKLNNYSTGGLGYDGCKSSPVTKGTDGGAGAKLRAGVYEGAPLGAREIKQLTVSVTDSFDGGNGGDGEPPGNGGAAGSTRYTGSFTKSFQPGLPGIHCPTSRTATGSLNDGTGSALVYSVQTNQPADAFELILPTGTSITHTQTPAGFSCTDTGNTEVCKGTVVANTALTGDFAHTGTIVANCGCVHVAFSTDNGATWSTPATLTGPPADSPGQTSGAVIIAQNELGWDTTANICQGATMHLFVTIDGIPPGTPVNVNLSGPGLPASTSFQANPGQQVEENFPGVSGPGTWTTQITSIGGQPPPTSGSVESSSAQC